VTPYRARLYRLILTAAWVPEGFHHLAPAATLLTGAVANGLYTLAGTTGILFALFCPWVAWFGHRLRRAG
jgi:hypothetical protein